MDNYKDPEDDEPRKIRKFNYDRIHSIKDIKLHNYITSCLESIINAIDDLFLPDELWFDLGLLEGL